jgi:hypothetical protein
VDERSDIDRHYPVFAFPVTAMKKPPEGGLCAMQSDQACARMNSPMRGAIISRQRRPEKIP